MKIENGVLYFSSGRTAAANQGIVGIADDLSISGGYDQSLFIDEDEGDLSPDERQELADYMIGLWQAFRDKG